MLHKELIELFIYHCERKSYAKATCKAYRVDLLQATEWFLGNIKPQPRSDRLVLDITSDHASSYMFGLENDYRIATVARKIAALKSFFSWLCDSGRMEKNPLSDIKLIRIKPVLRPEPTSQELEKLLNTPSSATFSDTRDRAMLNIVYGNGLRPSELVALNRSDIDLERNTIRVASVSGRERVLNLNQPQKDTIKKYLDKLGDKPSFPVGIDSPLFLNKHGGRISQRSFRRMVGKHARRLGLEVNPFLLRQMYATSLVRSGVGDTELRKSMGLVSTHNPSRYSVKMMF